MLTCVNGSAKRGESQEQPATMPNCSANMYTHNRGWGAKGGLSATSGVRLCRDRRLVKGQSAAAAAAGSGREQDDEHDGVNGTHTHSRTRFGTPSLSEKVRVRGRMT